MAPLDAPIASETSRRDLLKGAAGLVVAVALPMKARAAGAAAFPVNAYVRVTPDNLVTVIVKHIEFGQGPYTGLATLVADELDADWSQIRAEAAPSDMKLYGNPIMGGLQGTGGSSAIASSFDLMRKAGATARAMLVAAAAKLWKVPAAQITVDKGMVRHNPSGRSASFGDLAEDAASMPVPADVKLKTPEQFVYIGKKTPKLDTGAKARGQAPFTLDLYRDGMLTAVVAHPDVFGASVASVDDAAARAVPGVVDVKKIGAGVAVYAKNSYAALKGRKALKVEWDFSNSDRRTTEEIASELQAKAREAGAVAAKKGDVEAAFTGAATVLEAQYLFPYLVHAPMEPMDALIERASDGGVDASFGSQVVTADHQAIAKVCGLDPAQVRVHVQYAGGSFGRRAQPGAEFAVEAAEAFMAAGGKTPVKLFYTREDDIRGGFYRPMVAHRIRGALDASGNIIAWDQSVAGHSFLLGSPFEALIQNGVDTSLVEGAAELPYAMPNLQVTAQMVKGPARTLWWRSVGHTHTGYAVETFIDELLEKAGKDPIEGRIALMTEKPRLAGVLRRVGDLARWGRPPPQGRAFGVAAVESFNTCVAQIAEVSLKNGVPKVHNVWCAVDCGVAVNPDIIRAQIESGVGYGLGAILFNELRLGQGGAVEQSNFHDYRSLRIAEMPNVETTIVASVEAPTGVGEPGLPPIGPAVANAVRRLSGATPRRLPIMRSLQA